MENPQAYNAVFSTHENKKGQLVAMYKSNSCQSCTRLELRLKTIAEENPRLHFVIVNLADGKREMVELFETLGVI